jgi:hypothetical protein
MHPGRCRLAIHSVTMAARLRAPKYASPRLKGNCRFDFLYLFCRGDFL